MCKYCEKNIDVWKSSKTGCYQIASSLQIKNKKLLIRTNVNRKTYADEYYEYWGIDSDGESRTSTKTFEIKFCPFCGKKLIEEYKPKVYVFLSNKDKDNKFVKDVPWLIKEFDRKRKISYDTSDNTYYLRCKIQKVIKEYIENTKIQLGLKKDFFIFNSSKEKPTASEFKEIREFLNSGYNVSNSIDCNYKYLEQVIDKLKKLKYDVVLFDIDSVKNDNSSEKIEIPLILDLLND